MLELRYAIALEQKLSKEEILERYLNIAYFGDQTYGVQAAAQHYFNKSATDLTPEQDARFWGYVSHAAQFMLNSAD